MPPLDFHPDYHKSPITSHAKYGYFHHADYQSVVNRVGKDIEFRTNSLGLRGKEITRGPGTTDILAVGDSFTAGYGVEVEQAWPGRLEGLLSDGDAPMRRQVINGGVSGYNLSQIRMLTEDLVEKIEPSLVVLGLYVPAFWRLDDPHVIYRGHILRQSMVPRAVSVEGGFFFSPYGRDWLIALDIWLKQNFWIGARALDFVSGAYWSLYRSIRRDEPDKHSQERVEARLENLLAELERMTAFILTRDIALMVLLVNPQEPDGTFPELEARYNRIVLERCRAIGIACIDLLPTLAARSEGQPIFKLENDYHWSPAAHALAAEQIAPAITSWLGEMEED